MSKSRRNKEEKTLVLTKKVFTEDAFILALRTIKWLKIPTDSDFDIAIRAKMKTLIRELKPHEDDFNEIRLELAKEYGELNTKTQNYDFVDPEKKAMFDSKINELKPQEFSIKHTPFKLDQETENQFAIAELVALEDCGILKY
jgi:hypothetical protein